ncbi:hypothetical protein ACPCHQ_21805 [Ralstonia thomasii]|uniref:hypothetical protein n=1 Tax=Ralstonia thomasii TaxID=3058596 RepID=UPI003C2D669D
MRLLWKLRAALAYRQLAAMPWGTAYELATALEPEYRPDGYDPTDAVREDMTYWSE